MSSRITCRGKLPSVGLWLSAALARCNRLAFEQPGERTEWQTKYHQGFSD